MRTVKHLFTLYGRLRRRHYGYFELFSVALGIVVVMIASEFHSFFENGNVAVLGVGALVFLVWFAASISFTVRRLHDMALSGWIILILALVRFVPFAYWAVLGWLLLKRGTRGSNVFGPDPCEPPYSDLTSVFEGAQDATLAP